MSNLSDKVKEQFELQNNKLREFASELSAAQKLLWAAIYVNGTEVRIPDHVMRIAGDDQELESFYDPAKKETVIRSKVAVPKFNPSSTEPDKV